MKEQLQQEIEQCFLHLMKAWELKDAAALEKLLSADAVFFSEIIRNFRLSRNEYMDALLNRFPLSPSFRYEIKHVSVDPGHRTAVMQTKLSLSAPGMEDAFSHYLVTDVWVLEGEHWKLLMRQPVSLD